MKALKRICFVALLTGIFGGLMPTSSVCQMSQKAVVGCSMPCCKGSAQNTPSCPMIKAVAPQDLISLSTTQDVSALKVVTLLSFREFVAPANPMAVFDEMPVIPKNNSCSTPQAVPAPPAIA